MLRQKTVSLCPTWLAEASVLTGFGRACVLTDCDCAGHCHSECAVFYDLSLWDGLLCAQQVPHVWV